MGEVKSGFQVVLLFPTFFLLFLFFLFRSYFFPIFSRNTPTSTFFIPCHTIVVGYYGFMLVVSVSVRPLYIHPSVRFLFPDDNSSKHQWIFNKLGMCIDIVEIWFGIANGQISSIFDGVICLRHTHIFVSGL